MTYSITANTE